MPQTKVWETETRNSRKRPEFALFPAHRCLSLLPAESGTNRLQTADRDERNAWDEPIERYPHSTVTNGIFVTGRKRIFDFQQSGAVAAVAAKAHTEIG